jgi:hypothetical protein
MGGRGRVGLPGGDVRLTPGLGSPVRCYPRARRCSRPTPGPGRRSTPPRGIERVARSRRPPCSTARPCRHNQQFDVVGLAAGPVLSPWSSGCANPSPKRESSSGSPPTAAQRGPFSTTGRRNPRLYPRHSSCLRILPGKPGFVLRSVGHPSFFTFAPAVARILNPSKTFAKSMAPRRHASTAMSQERTIDQR